MTVTPTNNDLRNLIASIVNREIGPLTPETSLRDALGVDSLDVLRLLVAAEKRYGIYVTDQEMAELHCYGDLVRLLGIEAGEPVS
jgi:acyl carrier protein